MASDIMNAAVVYQHNREKTQKQNSLLLVHLGNIPATTCLDGHSKWWNFRVYYQIVQGIPCCTVCVCYMLIWHYNKMIFFFFLLWQIVLILIVNCQNYYYYYYAGADCVWSDLGWVNTNQTGFSEIQQGGVIFERTNFSTCQVVPICCRNPIPKYVLIHTVGHKAPEFFILFNI